MAIFLDQGVCKIKGVRDGVPGVYAVQDLSSPSRTLRSPREGYEDWRIVGSRSAGLVLENSVVLHNSQTDEFCEWLVGTGGEYLRQRPLDPAHGRSLTPLAG